MSFGLWKRRFDSDPGVVGRLITLNDAPVTVVGVLPPSFDFATVFAPGSRIDLYFPLPLTEEVNRRGNTVSMIGRLKPGATVQQARAELSVIGPQIQKKDPERNFQAQTEPSRRTRYRTTSPCSRCARLRGWRSDVDRVRESLQLAARPGRDPAKGDGHPRCARSRARPSDPSDAHREHRAVRLRRSAWAGVCS